jgi:hypothetical protein
MWAHVEQYADPRIRLHVGYWCRDEVRRTRVDVSNQPRGWFRSLGESVGGVLAVPGLAAQGGTSSIPPTLSIAEHQVQKSGASPRPFPNEQAALKDLCLVANQRRVNRDNMTGKINGWKQRFQKTIAAELEAHQSPYEAGAFQSSRAITVKRLRLRDARYHEDSSTNCAANRSSMFAI